MKKQIGLLTLGLLIAGGCATNEQSVSVENQAEQGMNQRLAELEKQYDSRLGVYAVDTESGEIVSYNAEDRFAFASTDKALSVGILLKQKSLDELEKTITYSEDDLVTYSPITEKHVDSGMTLKELSDASIRYSDNSAANFIFDEIGGPQGLTEALREIGDEVTQSERIETDLNDVKPGETQDTSTAKALAESLNSFVLEEVLEEEQRDLLEDWLVHNTTGDTLIRAGVPETWKVGDKTGSAAYGTRNDIGIVWPPNREPIVLAVLSSRDQEDAETDDQLIADTTKEVLRELSLVE